MTTTRQSNDPGIDTGQQKGKNTFFVGGVHANAIATNPLTIIGAGAAVLVGAEAVASAAAAAAAEATAAAAAEVVPENLTPFALRYLTTSGGRLGSVPTRQQLFEITRDYVNSQIREVFGRRRGT